MQHITATLINLFHVCRRELWLHAHEIRMEHTSDTVTEGKLIGEESYPQRAEKYTEVALEGIKIDYYDTKNKVVHEVKKSDKVETAHEAQVKYYLWRLEQSGIEGVTGIIEYPKLRHTTQVLLSDADRHSIPEWEAQIRTLLRQATPPPVVQKPVCRQCSYFEFCYS